MKKKLFLLTGVLVAMSTMCSCSDDSDNYEVLNIDFEGVSLGSGTYVNNLVYRTDDATFSNNFVHDDVYNYDSWDGFSYSCEGNNELTDITTGQYAVYNAGGKITTNAGHDSNKFAVAFVGTYTGNYPTITFDEPVKIVSFYLNNTAYAVSSMSNGDSFAKKFAEGDWFKLIIKGYATASDTNPIYTKEVYLADYRNSDQSKWTMLKTWTLYDGLGAELPVEKLVFDLASSDTGAYGMNTPAYFALDDLTFIEDVVDDDD